MNKTRHKSLMLHVRKITTCLIAKILVYHYSNATAKVHFEIFNNKMCIESGAQHTNFWHFRSAPRGEVEGGHRTYNYFTPLSEFLRSVPGSPSFSLGSRATRGRGAASTEFAGRRRSMTRKYARLQKKSPCL